jgi:hypothetical protein
MHVMGSPFERCPQHSYLLDYSPPAAASRIPDVCPQVREVARLRAGIQEPERCCQSSTRIVLDQSTMNLDEALPPWYSGAHHQKRAVDVGIDDHPPDVGLDFLPGRFSYAPGRHCSRGCPAGRTDPAQSPRRVGVGLESDIREEHPRATGSSM